MATFQQRASGKWTAMVRKKGFPQQIQTFDTRKEAEMWATDVEARMNSDRFSHLEGGVLLKDVIGMYLEKVTPEKKGSDSEEWRLKAIQRDSMAEYAVGKLTPAVIANWRDRRLEGVEGTNGKRGNEARPVSGDTVNRELNLLHHVLEVARTEWGMGTPTNPVSDVRRPKNAAPRDRRVDGDEEQKLLAAATKGRVTWMAPLIELCIETGMRQGEARELEWENVDLEDRVVILRWGSTKTDEMRGVPLSTRAYEVLTSIEPDPEKRKGRVFPDLTASAVKQAFARLRKRAGIEGVRFHDTRHEATSRLFEKGLIETEVMSVTGHKTNAMMRRYTHLKAKDLAKKLG
ncbi:site-specific integrase [Burkholderia cenocepacia]|uniref:site-specific integrase n=1 Tax=Burkholderia cenocepacia TaxID=95486 RepID=UPI002AB1982F|nr:site-specific integrase [Burkholderia cenocepacia]